MRMSQSRLTTSASSALLGAEVVVEQAARHAGLAGHVVERRARGAARRDGVAHRVDDARALSPVSSRGSRDPHEADASRGLARPTAKREVGPTVRAEPRGGGRWVCQTGPSRAGSSPRPARRAARARRPRSAARDRGLAAPRRRPAPAPRRASRRRAGHGRPRAGQRRRSSACARLQADALGPGRRAAARPSPARRRPAARASPRRAPSRARSACSTASSPPTASAARRPRSDGDVTLRRQGRGPDDRRAPDRRRAQRARLRRRRRPRDRQPATAPGSRRSLTEPRGRWPAGATVVVADVDADAADGADPAATPTPTRDPHPARRPARREGHEDRREGQAQGRTPSSAASRAGRSSSPSTATPAWPTTSARPREIGAHQGNDVFAPFGAPVLAVADGTLEKVGTLPISGNRLWLRTKARRHVLLRAPVGVLARRGRRPRGQGRHRARLRRQHRRRRADAAAPALRGPPRRPATPSTRTRILIAWQQHGARPRRRLAAAATAPTPRSARARSSRSATSSRAS